MTALRLRTLLLTRHWLWRQRLHLHMSIHLHLHLLFLLLPRNRLLHVLSLRCR